MLKKRSKSVLSRKRNYCRFCCDSGGNMVFELNCKSKCCNICIELYLKENFKKIQKENDLIGIFQCICKNQKCFIDFNDYSKFFPSLKEILFLKVNINEKINLFLKKRHCQK